MFALGASSSSFNSVFVCFILKLICSYPFQILLQNGFISFISGNRFVFGRQSVGRILFRYFGRFFFVGIV